jgi:hypothetical protein
MNTLSNTGSQRVRRVPELKAPCSPFDPVAEH